MEKQVWNVGFGSEVLETFLLASLLLLHQPQIKAPLSPFGPLPWPLIPSWPLPVSWEFLMDNPLLLEDDTAKTELGLMQVPRLCGKGSKKPQAHPKLWPVFRTMDSKHCSTVGKTAGTGCTLTLLGGFEAVVEVNPLDVIGQGCIGQQSPVPVDDVGRKSKCMLLSVHDLGIGAVCILKDSSCERWVKLCVLGKEGLLTKMLDSESLTDKIPHHCSIP